METNQQSANSEAASFGRQSCSLGIILLGFTLFLAACTSLSPISDDAKTLQEKIRTGQAVQQGDHVRVLTHDGMLHRLIVVSVEDDVLKGHRDTKSPSPRRTDESDAQEPEREERPLVDISIADIVLVEKEKVSAGKTAAAMGSGTLVFLSVLLLIALLA